MKNEWKTSQSSQLQLELIFNLSIKHTNDFNYNNTNTQIVASG